MADDLFNQPGNFVNPAYASPEQIANQRAYADFLTKNQMPVTGGNKSGWAQALANALNSTMGGYERGQANKQEQASQKAYAGQLLDAAQSGDRTKLFALAGNPRFSAAHATLLADMLAPGPAASVSAQGPGVGVNISQPTPPILPGPGGQGGLSQPPSVDGGPIPQNNAPQGPAGPPVAPPMPVPNPQRGLPPQVATPLPQLASNGPVSPNLPPADVPTKPQSPQFLAQAGAVPSGPKDQSRLGGPLLDQAFGLLGKPADKNLAQYGQDLKTQEATYGSAQKFNSDAVLAAHDSSIKLDALQKARQISDLLPEGGAVTPRIQALIKDRTGVMVGPNADANELFLAQIQPFGPEAIKQALSGLPRGGQLIEQFNKGVPNMWDKAVIRNATLNNLAVQHARNIEAGKVASEGGDPMEIQKKILNLPINRTPLETKSETLPPSAQAVAGPTIQFDKLHEEMKKRGLVK